VSLTHPDHAQVCIYGMRDSALSDDVATASRRAVELGATVVSRKEAPQIEAVFSNIAEAATFAIWLSRRLVDYHTYTLTQVTHPLESAPWPERDAERVKANCIAVALNYNVYAQRWRVVAVPEAYADLVGGMIDRIPLQELKQEI